MCESAYTACAWADTCRVRVAGCLRGSTCARGRGIAAILCVLTLCGTVARGGVSLCDGPAVAGFVPACCLGVAPRGLVCALRGGCSGVSGCVCTLHGGCALCVCVSGLCGGYSVWTGAQGLVSLPPLLRLVLLRKCLPADQSVLISHCRMRPSSGSQSGLWLAAKEESLFPLKRKRLMLPPWPSRKPHWGSGKRNGETPTGGEGGVGKWTACSGIPCHTQCQGSAFDTGRHSSGTWAHLKQPIFPNSLHSPRALEPRAALEQRAV